MTHCDVQQIAGLSSINQIKMHIDDHTMISMKKTFPLYTNPEVSIVIPVWNKPEQVDACLQSIIEHTVGSFEVIVVDNNSQEPTKRILRSFNNLHVITNIENKWFVEGCNQGAKAARGRYVLFLNSDTEVTPGWLDALVLTAKTYPRCGAVGGKLIRFDGSLQEAGSIIWNNGCANAYGRDDRPEKPQYCYQREVDYCSGACLLVRKDVFEELGGFDMRYAPAYYEDSDLCMALRQKGYAVLYQPAAVIKHHEFGSGSSEEATVLMRNHHEIFFQKWSHLLGNHSFPGEENVWRARDKREGKVVLVVDDRVPTPDQGMGYPRSYRMLCFLADMRYRVTLFPLQDSTPYTYSKVLQQKGIEVILGTYLDFDKFAVERKDYYDVVIVSRPDNMRQIKHVLRRNMKDASIIYDAEALFSARERLKYKILKKPLAIIRTYIQQHRELALAESADCVIAVSDAEADRFASVIGEEHTHVWGHAIEVRDNTNSFENRADLLFVGGGLRPGFPNEDAIVHFVQDVLPKVTEELQCKLYIVGKVSSERVQALASSNVVIAGYMDNLSQYYDNCRIFVSPSRFSAGIPWKVHEAMANGIPCVVSSILAKQLCPPDGSLLSAETPLQFAEQIIRLYTDRALWQNIQNAAIDYVRGECDPQVLAYRLQYIIRSASAT